ncbi:hypothetical protein [Bacteroides gallinarum]|uniref:hypothetical protein n=1 Tax=Bacteroides gallinarum TaxID=376806 RepID=UPI000372705E|nr:hypothetical protein [Bacteroides gallinarum]
MIEECNDIKEVPDLAGMENAFELGKLQAEYLKELNIPSDVWEGMTKEGQSQQLGLILERFNEINTPQNINREVLFSEIYSSGIMEAYKQLEAPQDYIQIERISDVFSECKELRYENWQSLELSEKVEVLNDLEQEIAEIEHRQACPIRALDMPSHQFGGYSPDSKTININASYIESSGYDRNMFREVLDTLVHEGRHAYQDYNVNVCEIHPRHSEVASWAETMEGGKWGYHGDTSTFLGLRLYEQQSIEIDARNFAMDVLDKFEQKQMV